MLMAADCTSAQNNAYRICLLYMPAEYAQKKFLHQKAMEKTYASRLHKPYSLTGPARIVTEAINIIANRCVGLCQASVN